MRINSVDVSAVWTNPTRDLTQTQFPFWSNASRIYNDNTPVSGSSTDIRDYVNTTGKYLLCVVDCYTFDPTAGTYQMVTHKTSGAVKLGGLMTTQANSNGHRVTTFFCILAPNDHMEFWVTNVNAAAITCNRSITALTL